MLRAAVPNLYDMINVLELILDDVVRDETAANLTVTGDQLAARLRRRTVDAERVQRHGDNMDLLEQTWDSSHTPEDFEKALAGPSFTSRASNPSR